MQERLALLARERGVGIREDEADGREEVGFARAVAADEEVESGAVQVRIWSALQSDDEQKRGE